jgi:hypothetical protein
MERAMAAHAVPPGGFEDTDAVNGRSPSVSSDPLRRLEAELGATPGEHAEDEQLYAEAQGLVEEAWSLVTECLVLRDGLLDACHEIEQTMDGIQRRLTALPVAIEADGAGAAANVARSSANSDGHVANGVPSRAPGDGHVANGTRSPANGSAGAPSDGHVPI